MIEVMKVGGSCLGSAGQIKKIQKLVESNESEKVLVVSAFRGVTNLLEKWFDEKDFSALESLVEIHRSIFIKLFPKKDFGQSFSVFDEVKSIHLWSYEREEVLALGEKMSAEMLNMYLSSQSCDISMGEKDPYVFGNNSSVNRKQSFEEIGKMYSSKKTKHLLTQGFASWDRGCKNNLGREGSDLSAVIWAKALGASCILYKDVGALYTEDPKKNPHAVSVPSISFAEYRERFFGAGIVYDKVIDFCEELDQSLVIASFDDGVIGTKFYVSDFSTI